LLKAGRLRNKAEQPVDVEFIDWWPPEIEYPCLYVGKSTNIKKRFSLHIKRKCVGRLHEIPATNEKQKPVTTSCQLRYGIEHMFKEQQNPLSIIFEKVGFSYTTDFHENAIAERFFTKDRLIFSQIPAQSCGFGVQSRVSSKGTEEIGNTHFRTPEGIIGGME